MEELQEQADNLKQTYKLSEDDSVFLDNIINKLSEAEAKIALFTEQLKLDKQEKFAPSTEQLELFDDFEADEVERTEDPKTETITYTRTKAKTKKRLDLSNLPRRQLTHDLEDHHCSCGKELVKIGEDKSEELEYIPAVLRVVEHITPKYICKACEIIKQAKKPETILPKALAAPSLIAEIAIKKYQHHLPLYRQAKIFQQQGIALSDNTLGNWILEAGKALEPIEKAYNQELLTGSMIQADETPVKVLSKDTKSYVWVYLKDKKLAVFEYASSRAGAVATNRLKNFKGILQTDGYAGYNELSSKSDIIKLGCMAHCRRKFVKIAKLSKQTGSAHQAISFITKLYNIEREIKELQPDERLEIRQTKAKPILGKFKIWLDKTQPKVGLVKH